MSRAFVIEGEPVFHCKWKDRDCVNANLRGDCDLDKCIHDNKDPRKKDDGKTEGKIQS